MPYSNFTKLGLGKLAPTKFIVELADRTMKHPKGMAENVLVEVENFIFQVDFIVLDMPEDIKTPLIFGRSLLSTAHSKIDVYKRKMVLIVGENKIVFTSDKPISNIIRMVYALGLLERMELDLEAKLMGEIWQNKVKDLGPTIDEGEVIDEPIEEIETSDSDDEIMSKASDDNFQRIEDIEFDQKISIDCPLNS
ncbi:DNA-directed DNA polymerase [Tanacetum coccineum]